MDNNARYKQFKFVLYTCRSLSNVCQGMSPGHHQVLMPNLQLLSGFLQCINCPISCQEQLVIICFLSGVRVHYEPTRQQPTMVTMVISCDIINSCHDINLECHDIMTSSNCSKIRSTHIIYCIKGGSFTGKVSQSQATRHENSITRVLPRQLAPSMTSSWIQ